MQRVLFDEALRIASKQKESDDVSYQKIIDTTIDPGVREGFAQITELLADCNSQIKSQVNRLNELRTKKAADPLSFFGGFNEDGDGGVVADNVSIAASELVLPLHFLLSILVKLEEQHKLALLDELLKPST